MTTYVTYIYFVVNESKVREPHYVCFNLFTELLPGVKEYSRKELKKAKRIPPILPLQEGYQIDYYRHNG